MKAVSFEVMLLALKIAAKKQGSVQERVFYFMSCCEDTICSTTDGYDISLSALIASSLLARYPGDNRGMERAAKLSAAIVLLEHNQGLVFEVLESVVQFRKF